MKTLPIYVFLMLLLSGAASCLLAQSPDDLLQQAVAANQELQALKKEYQAAQEKAPQVSQLPNPAVGVGAFILPIETRLGPQRMQVSASQSFPWFGTLKAQETLASTAAQAQGEGLADLELSLRYRLTTAYFRLYELRASQEILQTELPLLRALKELAETKVSTGSATLADVLRIDLRIDELTQRMEVLETRERKPQAEINQMLFRNLDTPITIEDTFSLARFNMTQDSLLAMVEAGHPILRMYARQQEAAQAALRVNELQGRPAFGLGATYFNLGQRSDAAVAGNGRDAFLLQATLSLPLYRQKYQAKAREEALRIDALEARKQETLSRFAALIEGAYAEGEEARLDLALYDRQIETTRAAIQIIEARYSAQSEGFDDLLQLEVALLDYRLKQLQAVVRSQVARAEVRRYGF